MSKSNNEMMSSIQDSPEVKAFIYQIITEFEPYVTPETLVMVLAKNPLHVFEEVQENNPELTKSELKKWHRISISLKEGESKIEAEAVSGDIYNAITLAKNKLLKHLAELHDNVISQQERTAELNHAKLNNKIH